MTEESKCECGGEIERMSRARYVCKSCGRNVGVRLFLEFMSEQKNLPAEPAGKKKK